MIVIGLGSGRSGTASLAQLINAQEGSLCFHELNPSGAVFEGNPQPAMNTINEFSAILAGGDKRLLALDYTRPASVASYQRLQSLDRVKVIGDIAFYYLNYVETILGMTDAVRFVCIKRDRAETVESWIAKTTIRRWPSRWLADRLSSWITRTPFHHSSNFWEIHDGSKWALDPVWDKTFPKFAAENKRDAIGKYWDYYYAEAESLMGKHPDRFRIFPIASLSRPEGQADILGFIGLSESEMRIDGAVHLHRSRAHR